MSSPRDTETLTDIQHVPSQQVGMSLQWNHVLKNHTLIAGIDFQEVIGASDEQLLLASAVNIAGGRQRSTGIFGQDIFRIGSKWTVIAGARWGRLEQLLTAARCGFHSLARRRPAPATPSGANLRSAPGCL